MDLKLKKLKNGSIRILETKPVLPFFVCVKAFFEHEQSLRYHQIQQAHIHSLEQGQYQRNANQREQGANGYNFRGKGWIRAEFSG